RMGPVISDLAVDLVAEDVEVVLAGELRDLLQVARGQHPTGRILRRVDHDQPGARRDLPLELLDIEAEVVAFAERNWHRSAARRGVVRVTVADRFLGRLDDVWRGGKVGLSDLQVDDVAALSLELAGPGQHLEGGLGANLTHPLGEFHRLAPNREGPEVAAIR